MESKEYQAFSKSALDAGAKCVKAEGGYHKLIIEIDFLSSDERQEFNDSLEA